MGMQAEYTCLLRGRDNGGGIATIGVSSGVDGGMTVGCCTLNGTFSHVVLLGTTCGLASLVV